MIAGSQPAVTDDLPRTHVPDRFRAVRFCHIRPEHIQIHLCSRVEMGLCLIPVDIVIPEQRGLHAAGGDLERLEEKRPDTERHGQRHDQHIQHRADGMSGVVVSDHGGELLFDLLHISVWIGSLLRQSFQFFHLFGRKDIPVVMDGRADRFRQIFMRFAFLARFVPLEQIHNTQFSLDFNTSIKASCGMFTRPISFIRFLPSFCFSSSFRFRVMSPP